MGRVATLQFIQDKDNPEKEFILTNHAPNGRPIIHKWDASNNYTLDIPRDPTYVDDFGRVRPLGTDLAAHYLKSYPKLFRLLGEKADTLVDPSQLPLQQSTAPGAPPVPFPEDPKPQS